jgi:tetratricopeptide (TPR) repeat protein
MSVSHYPCAAGGEGAWPCSGPQTRVRAAVLSLVLLALAGGCSKSDAERAAEERAEIEERIRDSYSLVPYRALKLTIRAQGQPNAPEEVAALWTALAETRTLPEKQGTEEEARRLARAYLDLGVAFYNAKDTLEKRDEDEFPLLWERWLPGQPPPLPGYDAGQEHAMFAGIWLILDSADRGNRVPATELVFYELSRATPQPTWLPGMRIAIRGNRGLAFCQAGYHYAAEEELDAFLSETEAMPAGDFPALQGASPEQSRETLLAAGYFLRAWNRLGLERERAAEEDIERGLASLERLGIDNELTWWGWAFIHFRRERYEESAKYLDRLAASPHVGEKERQEVQASADEMRRHGDKLPVFLQARAALILGQALIARAGGPEKMLASAVGPERAKELYAPIAWMDRVRQGVAGVSLDNVAKEAGDTLDSAREAGGKGLDALKQKLGVGSGEATAEPDPK